MNDPWKSQMEALGSFIRTQRKLADLSLRVLKSIANALNVSAETLLVQAGLLEDDAEAGEAAAARSSVESAIRTDPILSGDQKEALINVYRAMARDRRPGR
jgi:hypothetical protein